MQTGHKASAAQLSSQSTIALFQGLSTKQLEYTSKYVLLHFFQLLVRVIEWVLFSWFLYFQIRDSFPPSSHLGADFPYSAFQAAQYTQIIVGAVQHEILQSFEIKLKTLPCFGDDGYVFSSKLEDEWRKAQEFHKYCWDRTKVFQIGPIQGTPFCIYYACQNNSTPRICYTFTKYHKKLIVVDPTQKQNFYLHCINLFSCGMVFFAIPFVF